MRIVTNSHDFEKGLLLWRKNFSSTLEGKNRHHTTRDGIPVIVCILNTRAGRFPWTTHCSHRHMVGIGGEPSTAHVSSRKRGDPRCTRSATKTLDGTRQWQKQRTPPTSIQTKASEADVDGPQQILPQTAETIVSRC